MMAARRPWSSDYCDREEDAGSSWVLRISTLVILPMLVSSGFRSSICWSFVGLPTVMAAELGSGPVS